MTGAPNELDLGSFEDDQPDADLQPADAPAISNGADAPLKVNVEVELSELGDEIRYGPRAVLIAEAMAAAREASIQPKPTVKEMIETLTRIRWRLDDTELRAVACGDRNKPYAPTMRQAAVVGAAVHFLELLEANKKAVRAALEKGTRVS